jgi:MFS family permease|tara:strand:- start:19041 stop:20318 length:1278 start_codon:yes stop_codon:yes gene_type:complete
VAVASGDPRAARIFYGWRIVAAIFVILTFCSGLGFYNHTVMLQALSAERQFPITVTSTAVSLFFITAGVSGLLVARFIEWFDIRITLVCGGIVAGLSLAAIGRVGSVFELYAVYIVFGIGFSASGLLPGTTLVTRWFEKRRAVALAIASTGLSVGGVLITPLSAELIGSVGISKATPWLGAAYILGTVPVCILLVRAFPEDLGIGMDGEDEPSMQGYQQGLSFRVAMTNRFFWGMALSYIFVMLAQVGGIAHQFGLLSEQLSARQAGMALAVLPIFSVIGRLSGGWIVDRISIRGFTSVMMLAQCLALLMLGLGNSPWMLLAGLACFGVTVGNLLMLQPLLIAEAFGLLHYPRIYSVSNLLTTVGVATGPAAMGWIYAVESTYRWPYAAASAVGLLSLLIFICAGPVEQGTGLADDGAKPIARSG